MLAKSFYKNSALICVVIGLISCSTLYQKKHSDECRASFQFLKKNWRYDTIINMYTWGVPVLNDYVWKNINLKCLVGLSQREVEKIMGKPTKKNGLTWLYYYGPSNMPKTQYLYRIVFDTKLNSVNKIEESGIHYEPHN